jgi:putative hemolysin
VFAEEMGAQLASAADGLDRDAWDEHCDHLLVRRSDSYEVVGTYRILTAEQAQRAGGFYSEQEFDLGAIPALPRLVELGRACVHPEHRGGAVLALLWSALARHFRTRGYAHVIGCASVPVSGAPARVARLCSDLLREHGGPLAWRAEPRRPFPLAVAGDDAEPVPPLVRGYLRMGATVCGAPAWDPDFGTADLLLLLPMARMRERFAHRFLRAA